MESLLTLQKLLRPSQLTTLLSWTRECSNHTVRMSIHLN
uniref:Uncharacterized protein n=1 Tax=Lepeophtheirus salmonis TaxID=72036 RepID=A0A0K2UTP7_LEPSM